MKMKSESLANKVAIVTGGARGIGRSISLALQKEGASLVIADLPNVLKKHRKNESGFLYVDTDVSQKDQVNRLTETTVKEFGRIDILVNNAGICETTPIENLTEEQWDRMLTINLKSVFLLSQAVIPVMKIGRASCRERV